MNLQEIKKAVDQGLTVYWANQAYQVVKNNTNEYLIKCTLNNHCIGLTWQDGKTLNGDEKDFFIKPSKI